MILLFASLVGAGAGFAIVLFYSLVGWTHSLGSWLGGHIGVDHGGRLLPFVLVPAGLALARWLRLRLAPDSSGEMVPRLIHCAVLRGGEVAPRWTLAGVTASVITLGTGGSLGAEGPVAVGGGTIGSGLGQLFCFRPNRVRVLLACGTAAGISAAFNAPIAGVLFALEIVLGTFAVAALSPVVVASVVGAVVSRTMLGQHPSFQVPTQLALASHYELAFYTVLGLACGLLSVLFVRVFYLAQDTLARLPWPAVAQPLLGGLLVAAIGLVHPALLGPGHEGIQLALFGQIAGLTALSFSLLKIVASGITMGAGGAGGVLTPSLFIGAGFGSFFGLTLQHLFPALGITPAAYALVGMAALLAGATFAPLTAILMVFEITDDYALILPLMLVCVISYLVARRVLGTSVYQEALERQGEHISHGVDRSVLETLRVSDCYDPNPHVVAEHASLSSVIQEVKGSRQTEFPVVRDGRELVGVLSYQGLSRAMAEEGLMNWLVAADITLAEIETVTPSDSLLTAMRKMGLRDLDYLPVVRAEGSCELVGMVSRAGIMDTYRTHVLLNP